MGEAVGLAVGRCVGMLVGIRVGKAVGNVEGDSEGEVVGLWVGWAVGALLGEHVPQSAGHNSNSSFALQYAATLSSVRVSGAKVGLGVVGTLLGIPVGARVGTIIGWAVGCELGSCVGLRVGNCVGCVVGVGVGNLVGEDDVGAVVGDDVDGAAVGEEVLGCSVKIRVGEKVRSSWLTLHDTGQITAVSGVQAKKEQNSASFSNPAHSSGHNAATPASCSAVPTAQSKNAQNDGSACCLRRSGPRRSPPPRIALAKSKPAQKSGSGPPWQSRVGNWVGSTVGVLLAGLKVGGLVGCEVGPHVGDTDGTPVGAVVGLMLGCSVGEMVGASVGGQKLHSAGQA